MDSQEKPQETPKTKYLESARRCSARYYQNNADQVRKKQIIYRLKRGDTIKSTTLDKYDINPEDYPGCNVKTANHYV